MAHEQTADVVIIGGGVTGTSAVLQLASRGVRVILVEKKFLAAGSTGRSSAVIRQHYSNAITARMAKYSLGVFQNFAGIVSRWAAAMISGECSTHFFAAVSSDDKIAKPWRMKRFCLWMMSKRFWTRWALF